MLNSRKKTSRKNIHVCERWWFGSSHCEKLNAFLFFGLVLFHLAAIYFAYPWASTLSGSLFVIRATIFRIMQEQIATWDVEKEVDVDFHNAIVQRNHRRDNVESVPIV